MVNKNKSLLEMAMLTFGLDFP